MASAEREPIMGVWGLCPQRGPEAEPLVRGAKPRISVPRIKLAAPNFAGRFIGVQGRKGISHFGEICSTRIPKSDESARA